MKTWILIGLAMSRPAFAAGGDAWTQFERLREGAPPSIAAGVEFDRARTDLRANALDLLRTFLTQIRTKEPHCAEFVEVTTAALRSLARTTEAFKDPSWSSSDDATVLARARLILLLPSIQGLRRLFAHGLDGGYGTIDLRPSRTCEYADRARVDREFADLAARVERFRVTALGQLGVLPLERLTDRLLDLAEVQQARYDRISTAITIGTLISTLVIWELAPARALKLAPGWRRISALMALGVTEGLTYRALEVVASPEVDQRALAGRVAVSWDEHMRDFKQLARSPVDQPQLYLAYLSVVQAHFAGLVGEWVGANQDELSRRVSE